MAKPLHALWLIAAVGCSGATSDRLSHSGPPDVQSPHFTCAAPSAPGRVRVETSFGTVFGAVDAKGNGVPAQPIDNADAIYVIESLSAPGAPPAARIVLESQGSAIPAVRLFGQSAWADAAAKGWVKPGEPFAIERREDGWHWRDLPDDAERTRFAQSIGVNVDLLGLSSAFAGALDGKMATSDLWLPIPDALASRLQVKGPALQAHAQAPGLPATYVIVQKSSTVTQRKSKAKDGTETAEPQNVYNEVEGAVTVDASCQIVEVRSTQQAWAPLFEGKLPSGARLTRTLRWRFTTVAP